MWAVVAVLWCLGAVLFFQHVPRPLRWPLRVLCLGAALWLILLAVQALRTATFTRKKLAFSFILALLLYAALSLICHFFIGIMSPRDDRLAARAITSLSEDRRIEIEAMLNGTSYEMYDRDIGWVPRPGFKSDTIQISRQGLRSLREYPQTPPDPAKRILCLGDSFTFGYAVSDVETYPYHAEQLRPDTEWINLGISGTCLTQSYLHYRKSGRKFGGKHVVIGFMTDDARRTVNCFRPFVNPGNPFTKPFAKYSGGTFSIEPNPYQEISDFRRLLANERGEIERLLKIDYLTWSNQVPARNPILRTAQFIHEALHLDRNLDSLLGRPVRKAVRVKPKRIADPYGRAFWDQESLGFKAVTRLFDRYYGEIIADGRVPLIVIIPGPLDVENYKNQVPRLYGSLIEHFKANRYRHLDFLDPLVTMHSDDLSTDALFVHMHYRSSVNKELAAAIIKALQLP